MTDRPEASSRPANRCGVIAVAGLPNAGKSTLVNRLVGEKVAIVAAKPQTTRTAIRGVLTRQEGQAIFIDTPGIHRSDTYFNRRMMSAVRQALDSPDARIYVADGSRAPSPAEWEALDTVKRAQEADPKPSVLVLNKVDLIRDKRAVLPKIEAFREHHAFDEFVPVSSLNGEGVEKLARLLFTYLPEGPPLFSATQYTDQPVRHLAGEMIREQILRVTQEEVPHSVAVKVEEWEEKPNLTRIGARITVERSGQKGILIGAGGQMLKRIGTGARREIEGLTGAKVFLKLFVDVKERWRENEAFVNELDWRQDG